MHDRSQLDWWYWPMLTLQHRPAHDVYAVFFLWMAVAFAFAVGFFTRTMNVALWLLTACFMVRNPLMLCGSDDTLQIAIFLLMIAPSGRALSVDAWWRRRRGLDLGPSSRPRGRAHHPDSTVRHLLHHGLVKMKGDAYSREPGGTARRFITRSTTSP